MSDSRDEIDLGMFQAAPRPGDGPEEWLGIPDPVRAFSSTIEQAMRQLSLELAGIRAERDGLRLELEGIRAQLQLAQAQLADRDRFAAAVRELNEISHRMQYQVGGADLRAAPMSPGPPPPEPPVASAPPVDVAPPPAFTVTPTPPAAPAEALHAPPAAPAPAATVFVAPSTGPASTPQEAVFAGPEAPGAPAAEPAPAPEAVAAPPPEVIAPPGAPQDEAVTGPGPVAPPREPEPILAPPPAAETPRRAEPATQSYAVETTADSFFSQPGVWLGEPPKADGRLSGLKRWGQRVGGAIAVLIIAAVSIIAVGPKFLPYQTLFVRSGSMTPFFDTGDMIFLTKTDAAKVKVGEVITFERPDKPGTLVTHRVVAVETTADGKQFQTKGDANNTPDAWRVPANGAGWKYAFRVPKLGFVVGYLGTPAARLALLVVPAVALGILSLIDLWKPQPKSRRRR